jgi:hypothetical protein
MLSPSAFSLPPSALMVDSSDEQFFEWIRRLLFLTLKRSRYVGACVQYDAYAIPCTTGPT